MTRALACALLLLLAAPSFAVDGGTSAGASEPRACGSTAELAAAKAALASGDRMAALAHLQRARTLAGVCESRRRFRESLERMSEDTAERAWAALRSAGIARG